MVDEWGSPSHTPLSHLLALARFDTVPVVVESCTVLHRKAIQVRNEVFGQWKFFQALSPSSS